MSIRPLFLIACIGCSSGGSGTGDDSPPPPDGPPMTNDGPDVPPPDEPPNNVCDPNDANSCSGETVCIGTTCEPAFNRIYRFKDITSTVSSLNQNGQAWDSFGGAPDPQVIVKLNGTVILTTASKSDVFTASFTESIDQQVVAGSKLELILQDADLNAADPIHSCIIDPLSAQKLRERGVHCDGTGTEAGSQVVIHFDAKN